MRTVSVSMLVLSLAAVALLSAQQHPMRPGRWQNSVQMQMPAQTSTRGVTAEQLEKDPNSWLPSGPDGRACTIADQKIVRSTVSWKVTCTGQMAMTGEGELTFMGDTYEGTLKAAMAQGEVTMKLTGKRLGDCMP